MILKTGTLYIKNENIYHFAIPQIFNSELTV